MTWLMLDHPAWDLDADTPVRALRTSSGVWTLTGSPVRTAKLIRGDGPALVIDSHDPASLLGGRMPAGLAAALHRLGRVERVRNPDLWEALATAIIRQVIRAGQARKMHRAFRAAAGETAGVTWLIPTPEQTLALSAEDFAALGMAFKRRPLQAAAAAYLDHHAEWAQLAPDALVKALQSVPRIGLWTAGAAGADFTGDFSQYPYADLAVRTWAALADPATAWPADEPGFADAWRHAAGPHLSVLTVLTLAWGDHHAHADQGSTHH